MDDVLHIWLLKREARSLHQAFFNSLLACALCKHIFFGNIRNIVICHICRLLIGLLDRSSASRTETFRLIGAGTSYSLNAPKRAYCARDNHITASIARERQSSKWALGMGRSTNWSNATTSTRPVSIFSIRLATWTATTAIDVAHMLSIALTSLLQLSIGPTGGWHTYDNVYTGRYLGALRSQYSDNIRTPS